VMLSATVIKELRNAPFLRGLTKQQASLLSTLFHPRRLLANSLVFEEGQRTKDGPSLFFCNSGTLTMHQSDQSRAHLLIRYIQPNEFFGEACMLFDLSRIATVRTVSDCLLSELPYSAFATFLRQFPSVSIDMTCAFNQQSIPTQHLLSNPTIMAAFAMFVAHEASMENVAFWMAARKFRMQATRNKQFLIQDARALYETYISPDAAKQVNLRGTAQATLQKAIQHGCITKLTFEEAEQEILTLMDLDSFARFRLSKEFSNSLELCRREPRMLRTNESI
jgi:CRP-like cAMP-binding protein